MKLTCSSSLLSSSNLPGCSFCYFFGRPPEISRTWLSSHSMQYFSSIYLWHLPKAHRFRRCHRCRRICYCRSTVVDAPIAGCRCAAPNVAVFGVVVADDDNCGHRCSLMYHSRRTMPNDRRDRIDCVAVCVFADDAATQTVNRRLSVDLSCLSAMLTNEQWASLMTLQTKQLADAACGCCVCCRPYSVWLHAVR